MRKLLSGFCAAAILATMGITVPASASPRAEILLPQSQIINAQGSAENILRPQRHRGGNWDRGSDRRDRWNRGDRWDRGDRGGPRWRGHRGYRDYRPGYRRHGGYWFPPAAFITGAIVGGALAQPSAPRARGYTNAHIEWCYDRYRSYRASDNTFQPYNGPRRQCRSPYY